MPSGQKNAQKTHCPKGHEYTPENIYSSRANKGRRCKTCAIESARAQRTPAERRVYKWQYTYRLSLSDVESMWESTGGCCPICGKQGPPIKEDIESTSRMFWAVDHDHGCCEIDREKRTDRKTQRRSCGKCARGLLCFSCNSGLGIFGDSQESLQRAIEYLEATKSRPEISTTSGSSC